MELETMKDNRPIFSAFADSRTGNRGAVSMLESAIDHLTTAPRNAVVNVFTVYPRDDRQLPPTPNVNIHSGTPLNLFFKLVPLCLLYRLARFLRLPIPRALWGREMNVLLDTDVCLAIGGTTFSDAKVFKVIFNVYCLLPAILLGKKTILYSQTLGPFRSRLNRFWAYWCLSRVDVVIPRGPESLGNVRGLGLPGRVVVEYCPDAAFSLVIAEATQRRIAEEYARLDRGRGVVGISVNSIVGHKCRKLGIDHDGAWVQLIRHLHDSGYTILLIPHSMRSKSTLRHNNDLIAVAEIVSMLPGLQRLHVIDHPYDCKELRVLVGLCDYYVASRFHSMISALCTAVPVVVYGWGFQKYSEVLEEFELAELCHDGADLSGAALVAAFEDLLVKAPSIVERIRRNLPRIQEQSRRNHDLAWSLRGPDTAN
jgi:polysaccharide pyruvyl transferase WcaK-like protein